METLRRILEAKLSEKPKKPTIDEKTIQFLFAKIIQAEYGAQGKSNVLVLSFQKGILTLGVYKSLWQAEITLIREDLQERLNTEIGSNLVKDIRIQRK